LADNFRQTAKTEIETKGRAALSLAFGIRCAANFPAKIDRTIRNDNDHPRHVAGHDAGMPNCFASPSRGQVYRFLICPGDFEVFSPNREQMFSLTATSNS
jgi:hypothetical protein